MALAGGTGTSGDPYLVATSAQLNEVRDFPSAHFKQTADIDLIDYENWLPIGDSDIPFSGCYDGQNYKISNLTINRPTESSIGLFGNACFDGLTEVVIFQNINLVNASVTGMQSVGIVCGYFAGQMINCHVSGTIIADKEVGGLVGTFWERGYEVTDVNISKMIGCSANCTITSSGISNGSVGGLVGSSTVYLIENCYSSGNINVLLHDTSWDIGGLVGTTNENAFSTSIIKNCYSTSNITITCDASGAGGDIGGFIGSLDLATLTNCYSIGSLTITPNGSFSVEAVGGLIGYNWNNAVITDCVYDTTTSGQTDNDGRGVPKTTEEMKEAETFSSWPSEDWVISETINEGYPYLVHNTTGIVVGVIMGLSSRKITTYAKNIVDLPDRPNENGYTAATLKAFLDGRGDEEIKTSINGIVDDLVAVTDGSSGADQVGATAVGAGTAETVQGILEELHARIAALE